MRGHGIPTRGLEHATSNLSRPAASPGGARPSPREGALRRLKWNAVGRPGRTAQRPEVPMPSQGRAPPSVHSITGMLNSPPSLIPEGQRAVTVLVRV